MARWDKISRRGRVEDRRGNPVGLGRLGGGIGAFGVMALLLFSIASGDTSNLNQVLQQIQTTTANNQQIDTSQFAGEDDYEVFASTVLGSNNELWQNIFNSNNLTYSEPRLVLFRQATSSGCGGASSATGPHYCPVDNTIYLDETFFDELTNRFGAEGGDVAEAYVIAHEVAHHVQNELDIMERVQAQQQSSSRRDANQLSVKQELQADCFAGIWANSIRDTGIFGPNEINEAINAAESIGDDRIQQTTQGRVNPESWTHGSSQQRVDWFNRGYNSGDPNQCNTF